MFNFNFNRLFMIFGRIIYNVNLDLFSMLLILKFDIVKIVMKYIVIKV